MVKGGAGGDGIKIFLRIRPTKKASGRFIFDDDKQKVSCETGGMDPEAMEGLPNNSHKSYNFKFDHVLPMAANQADVFDIVSRPVLNNVLEGFNSTIFAYGQTGSGKTFTITGGAERYVDRGIIPRTLSYLFEEFSNRSDTQFKVYVSYLEIYNNSGYDLLDADRYCVCVYVCLFVCVCVFECVCVCKCVDIDIDITFLIKTLLFLFNNTKNIHIYINIHTHTHTNTYIYIHTHTRTHTYIYIYIYI